MIRAGILTVVAVLPLFGGVALGGPTVVQSGKGDLDDSSIRPVTGLDAFPDFTVSPDIAVEPVSVTPAAYETLNTDSVAAFWTRIEVPDLEPYDSETFAAQATAIPWDIAAAFAATTYLGIVSWDWGSTSFQFHSEGWFGKDTGSLGMDKLGHAYTTYLFTEYFTQRIAHSVDDRRGAAVTGALLAMGVQTYVEVFDGFSGDHGFSYEDMVMDGVGAGFSVLRSAIPGLADKLDFRMEYLPSGHGDGFRPVSDYAGQKYLLALKLAGFETFEDTPLRFVELQAGYYARGFTDEEEANGAERRREPYVAIGFNLQELFDSDARGAAGPALIARRSLEYVQVPYTYIATSRD